MYSKKFIAATIFITSFVFFGAISSLVNGQDPIYLLVDSEGNSFPITISETYNINPWVEVNKTTGQEQWKPLIDIEN